MNARIPWDQIWSLVNRVVTVNAGVAVSNAPLLLALAVVDRPWRYPVFFAVLALGLGPALAASLAYLSDVDGGWFRAYRRGFGRALRRWAVTVAVLGVLLTDVVVLHDSRAGAALVPLLVVLAGLVCAAGTLALHPGVTARLAVWAAVRQWHLSLFSLALLTVALLAVNRAPLLGLATVPGLVLVAVTANGDVALRRVSGS